MLVEVVEVVLPQVEPGARAGEEPEQQVQVPVLLVRQIQVEAVVVVEIARAVPQVVRAL
jgi:hypothetical protein